MGRFIAVNIDGYLTRVRQGMARTRLDFVRNRTQGAHHVGEVKLARVVIAGYCSGRVCPRIRYEVGTGVEPGLGAD